MPAIGWGRWRSAWTRTRRRRRFAAPIGYGDTADIQSSLKALVEAGAEVARDVMDVGGGLLVARRKDADGNFLGLRQSPE
jgi:predicted enzyme related to lactoylglutathione lyase